MGQLQVRRSEGVVIDSTFSVELLGGQLSVVIESRGGTRGAPAARNTDYAEGVEILLSRLKAIGAQLEDAYVESRATADFWPSPAFVDTPTGARMRKE